MLNTFTVDKLSEIVNSDMKEAVSKFEENHFQWVKTDKNSFSFWYPYVKASGVPSPESIVIQRFVDFWTLIEPMHYRKFVGLLEKETKNLDKLAQMIHLAASQLGFPAFLRNGHGSNKHDFSNSCLLLDDPTDVKNKVFSTIDFIFGTDRVHSMHEWVVREYIEPDTELTAPHFGDMPLRKERRYFILNGKVIGHSEYWIEEALEGQGINPEVLKAINQETEEEVELLTGYAEAIGSKLNGFWSIDFMWGRGQWWCIDMATGESSWVHPRIKGDVYKALAD